MQVRFIVSQTGTQTSSQLKHILHKNRKTGVHSETMRVFVLYTSCKQQTRSEKHKTLKSLFRPVHLLSYTFVITSSTNSEKLTFSNNRNLNNLNDVLFFLFSVKSPGSLQTTERL